MSNMDKTQSLDCQKWAKTFFWFWVYTVIVILWGAWVRISHSGDGCGDHYPFCDGQLIPAAKDAKTWIEFTHRLMTGSYGLVVIYFFFKLKNHFKNSKAQILNYGLLGLMLFEAFIGAVLVKFELVATNDSLVRLATMSLHQISSFLLTGVTYILYLVFKTGRHDFKLLHRRWLFIFLILPMTGAIAALSTTLFPSQSVWSGILIDLAGEGHPLIRYRILHPLLAMTLGAVFIVWLTTLANTRLVLEFTVALIVGVVTVFTLSPLPLKILHLTLAHYLWARLLVQAWESRPDSSKRYKNLI